MSYDAFNDFKLQTHVAKKKGGGGRDTYIYTCEVPEKTWKMNKQKKAPPDQDQLDLLNIQTIMSTYIW